jgi:hypothetical protein
MADTFDPETLKTLDRTAEIDIETSRGEGAPVHRVTIWIVVDGDDAFVRSVRGRAGRGPPGRWYRELSANPRGAIHVNGRRLAIEAEPATDADSVSRVSDALKRKYEQRWAGPLAGMLREQVLPTTMRVKPA